MHNNNLVIVVSFLLLGMTFSGCIGFGTEEECKLPTIDSPQNSSRPVLGELRDKWRHSWEDPEGTVLFEVGALRTSPPDIPYDPPDRDPVTTSYVDWHSIRPSSYSEVLHDFLCVTEWRGENINRNSYFSTEGSIGVSLYDDLMEKLRYEFQRQNKEKPGDEWCCYILYKGEFYGTQVVEDVEY